MEPTYISAFPGIGTTRMYVGNDGNIYEFSGGSRAWRNNNPGNLEDGKFARDNGAIGSDGRFAIFPDATTGFNAMTGLYQIHCAMLPTVCSYYTQPYTYSP